nr:MAG TPA: hypothetical protein [Caudoviricetes sp.]
MTLLHINNRIKSYIKFFRLFERMWFLLGQFLMYASAF